MNIIIYISIFTFQLGLKAIGDWWYKNKKKKIINHGLSSGIDIAIYIVAGYFFIIAPYEPVSVLFSIGVLVTTLSMRWWLYDLIYNIINKEKYNHLGGSAGLDQLLKWFENKGISQYIIKGLALLIGINLIVCF